ncbi:ribosome assembly RNA-binding protein YhbY [Lactobacillus sp. LC28-10]|uniref:Ribosome assembly RNA-binding protein YhbY n=1 Tax=Secundilactobacillus angelensis TaxID=2722706 RepID=A0ABX1L190_9LACO|nr:ribosome assembly RNA-binding protein YhbY [Secundilactobacillus angelensis]MCH5462721.1 ribosome assembly RNA-binding protein YhbY [Secundilactobacillus angelensis]NLR18833.1 ribosome assembly RNA-binding protein YhbY [Secundilactobacillus angelensis]
MNLKGKQKRFLRAQAHHLNPIFSVGKNGLNQTWLAQLDGALQKRELIKINLQQSADETVEEVQAYIEDNTAIQVVQTIGRVLVLFQPASEEKYQDLSLQVKKLA